MCYFVAVGAKVPRWVMAQAFEDQAELDLGLVAVCAHVASAFPRTDEVSLVTSRGCSCDLLGNDVQSSASKPGSRQLASAFRQGLITIAREVGSVRLIVHRHAGRPSSRCRTPHPRAPFIVELHELLKSERWFIEDVLMEVRVRSPAAHPPC